MVYRLLEYSIKEELIQQFGKETQIDVFRKAGRRAGEYFAKKMLNLDQPLDQFVSELQAKQVAKGDYSQTVSYLGEFSDAFNTMTKQLEEREARLKQEPAKEKAYAKMLNRYNQELEVEANQDELTQIGNRHFFIDKMEKLLKTDEDLVICYCDLDHLKYINDKYGHAEGDWYIRYFVEIVKKHIRGRDIFTRVGGDEFCIVLCGCPVITAKKKIERIQTIFHSDRTKGYPKSFSCGIIKVPHERENMKVMDIIKQADAMMYEQKKKHKKTYQSEL